MCRRFVVTLGVLGLLATLFTTPTFGQNAPNGWIQSGAWTYMLLDQAGGCNGGNRTGNWLAPYDITDIDSNPVAGDEPVIDFALAESRSWTGGDLNPNPIWLSSEFLNTNIPNGDFPTNWNGVDFNNIIDRINQQAGTGISNDNVMAVAVTYVENLTDAPLFVNACTRSDDSIRIDINGVTVTDVQACRGWGGESCQEERPGWLEPGVNKVTMYVWEGGGGFGGGLRFSSPGCAGGILDDNSDLVAFLGANDGDLSGVAAGDNGNAPAGDASYAPNNKLRAGAWNFMILMNDGGAAPGEDRIRGNWTAPFDVLSENPMAGDVWEVDFAAAQSQRAVAPFTDDGTNEGNPVWFTNESAGIAGWQTLNPNEDGINYDDFAGRNGSDRDNIMALATTYVENTTDADIPVTVCTCSDDSLLVHVNETEVAIVNRGRGWCGGAHECQEQNCAVLVPGVNQITIQVWEGGGGWNFRLGLLDFQTGQPITDCNDLGITYLGPGDGALESDGSAACPRFTIEGPWLNTEQWNHLLLENDRGCGPGDVSLEGNWTYPYVMADEDPMHGDEWEIDFNNAQSSGWGGTRIGCEARWMTREGALADDPAIDLPIRGDGLMDMNDWCNRIGARNDNAMWIGTTYVNNTNDFAVPVDVCTASDDSVRVDINNYIVTRVNACRGSAGDCQETRPGELAPGVNKITAYVYEGGGGFNGRFRLTARCPDGCGDGVDTIEQFGIEFLGPGDGDFEGAFLNERPERSHGEQWEPDVIDPGGDGEVAAGGINPNGWIQTDGWNLLVPVGNPHGCGGGGVGLMATSWTGDFLIEDEDPQDGDEWDIDWSLTEANGYPGQTNNPDDIAVWRTAKTISDGLGGVDCGEGADGPSQFNGDLVDFQAICVAEGTPNDNVMAIATTYVENLTGEDLPIQVCTSSDDSVACYVNDELRQNISACRGSGGDCQERADAILAPGVNKLALLVWEGGGGFNMRFAIEANGAKLNDRSIEVDFLGAAYDVGPPEICDNGVDDDGDGAIDCVDRQCPPCPEICDNGTDDDRDGRADCDDSDCAEVVGCFEICDNGIDDNDDGDVDGDDIQCSDLEFAGALLVSLDARDGTAGSDRWRNQGSMGDFRKVGNPQVEERDFGIGVSFNENGRSGETYESSENAPAGIIGANPTRSIEIWVWPETVSPNEETLVAWGKRGGPDGSNMSFLWGNNAAHGAVGHWGAPDLGWNNAGGIPDAQQWHHLVYTYDGETTRVYADNCLVSADCANSNEEFLGAGRINTHGGTKIRIAQQTEGNGVDMTIGLQGKILVSKLRIHDGVLTPEQITHNYESELPQFQPGAPDPEVCDDGIDNDGDDDVDCDDDDCAEAANCGVAGPRFVRGDANSDGSINLTDGVIPLLYLFSGGAPPTCLDSADTNDTGSIEITDAIIVFGWLFSGGVPPAEPSPLSPGYSRKECAVDPTDDNIGCDQVAPTCN